MEILKQSKFLLPITILLFFIINVVQGSITELLPDEAYYWIYSQHMDWGFFDHPPLVAIWILISDYFFSNEMGVRFFSAISFSFLTYIVWLTIDNPKKKEYTWLFLLIFFSTALINVYGFITTPDTALLLFSALFLFAYQYYLKSKSIYSYLLLSISITGMMYSKYQSVLIILFVVLSNWKLVKDYKLWLVCLVSLLLYFPHLYWQWIHDFPSFRYHLQERVSNRMYKFEHTLMHFVNMIAIIGLTFPIIYKAFFKNILTKNTFFKSLNFIIIGFLVFFFFSSFRGRVQAQWIVPISIPLILISFDFLINNKNSRKWFIRLAFINISIMLVARILLFTEGILPKKLNTHGNKEWALKLQSKTIGKEKIFINSFQNLSTYWYYTKEKAYYMKNFTGRNNHFVMLQKHMDLSSNNVALVSRNRLDHTNLSTHVRGKDSIFTTLISNYKDLSQIEIDFTNEEIVLHKNKPNRISVDIKNNFERSILIDDFKVFLGFLKNKKTEKHLKKVMLTSSDKLIPSNGVVKGFISFQYDGLPDESVFPTLGIGIINSEKTDLIRVSKLLKYTVED